MQNTTATTAGATPSTFVSSLRTVAFSLLVDRALAA
jgi:hypothetical protein